MSETTSHEIPDLKIKLPHTSLVLVLGLFSIITCWMLGIPGLMLGIIALILAKKSRAHYDANRSIYTETSLKNMNIGRLSALVGTALSGLYLLLYVIKLIVYSSSFGNFSH